MKRVNVRELHHRTGAIIDAVSHGDVVVVEKRGTPVAEIRPLVQPSPGFLPSRWEKLRRFPKLTGDSGRSISDDRDRG